MSNVLLFLLFVDLKIEIRPSYAEKHMLVVSSFLHSMSRLEKNNKMLVVRIKTKTEIRSQMDLLWEVNAVQRLLKDSAFMHFWPTTSEKFKMEELCKGFAEEQVVLEFGLLLLDWSKNEIFHSCVCHETSDL